MSYWPRAARWVSDHEIWLVLLIAPLMLFPRRWSWIAFVALGLLWLVRWKTTGRLTARTPLDWPILGILMMTLVSLYPSVDLTLSATKFYGIVLGVAAFYAMTNSLKNERAVMGAAWAMVGIGAAVALVSIAGTDWPQGKYPFGLSHLYDLLPRLIDNVPRSLRGGFHANEVGGTMAGFLPLAVALFFTGCRRMTRLSAIIVVLVMGFVLLLSQSRSGVAGFTVGLLVLAVWRSRWFLLVLPATLAVTAIAVHYIGVEPIKNLFFPMPGPGGDFGTWESRLRFWGYAWNMIQDFPFTGIGLNTFPIIAATFYAIPQAEAGMPLIPHAHNLFLQVAVDLGIPGLIAFVALLVLFFLRWGQVLRRPLDKRLQILNVGLGAAMVSYLVFNLTDAITLGAKPGILFWALLALTLALARTSSSELATTS